MRLQYPPGSLNQICGDLVPRFLHGRRLSSGLAGATLRGHQRFSVGDVQRMFEAGNDR
jgi:hypothetical protein